MSLLIVFLYIVIPLCSLIGVHRVSSIRNELKKDSSLELRGVGMIMIVLTHATVGAPLNASFFWSVTGIVGVALCFFLSGYGLFKSWKKKENYLQEFLPKRFVRVLSPYIIVYAIFVASCILLKEKLPLTRAFFELVTLQMGRSPLWYMKVQLLLYLLFYISFRFSKQEHMKIIMLALSTFAYYFIAILLDIPDYWYNTCLFFPLGLILARYEKQLFPILVGIKSQLISLVVLFLTYGVIYFRGWIIPVLVENTYMITFIICLIGVSSYFSGSKFLKIMGKYSMEVYLIHSFLLNNRIFGLFAPEKTPSYIMLFCLTLLLAVPINHASNKLSEAIV